MLIGANDTTNLPMPTENLRYICYNFIQKSSKSSLTNCSKKAYNTLTTFPSKGSTVLKNIFINNERNQTIPQINDTF